MTTSPVASITDEQLAEIEALSLEAEAFDWAPDIGMSHSETVYACHVGPSVIRALIARLRAAEKDAARYRWLCDGNGYFMEQQFLCGHSNDKLAADLAIDEAMEQQP